MLQKAEQRGTIEGIKICPIEGIKICRRAPRINHLFFADDSLILMRARENVANELKYILELYEQAAGQKVNRDKSSIMFSPNTSQGIRSEIKSYLSIVLKQGVSAI